MRQRWFSRRAALLHAVVLVAVPACLYAGWWQATRAMDGNPLSYAYAIEWPAFALIALYVWWTLLHTDPETVGARALRRDARDDPGHAAVAPVRHREEEDEALAAYNDHLAELAARGSAKTWRSR